MDNFRELLVSKVTAINQDPEKKEKIREWINGYRGKVICFQVEESGESYHLVFDKDKVILRKGNYSSCEFTYIGPRGVLVNIIHGKESARKAGMSAAIKGWGSLNEALQFEQLLS